MTSLVRHRTRWCLLFTGALLAIAFTLHDVSAQFPQRPPFQAGGGFAGRPGGISGVPGGGFAGRPGGIAGVPGGNFAGMPGGITGVPGGGFAGQPGGITGIPGNGFVGRPSGTFSGFPNTNPGGLPNMPGVPGLGGGSRFVYTCSKCKRQVGEFDVFRCPHCGVQFSGTTFNGGSNPGFNPGMNPGFNPGFRPGQTNPVPPLRPDATVNLPPNAWKPVTPAPNPNPPATPDPSKPASDTSAKSSSSDSKSSDDKSGVSTKIIIGAGVAALGLFALIAGVIVAMNSGGSASQKLKRRPKRFD